MPGKIFVTLFAALTMCVAAQAKDNKNHGATMAPPPDLKFEKVKLADNRNEGCTIADIDNDGKMDIIAGPYWYAGPDWERRDLREVGTNGEFMFNSGDHPLDVNGDGWVDVISGSWFSDKTFWYENPGKDGLADGGQWEKHLIAEGNTECEAMILEDIDRDGTPEIVMDFWNPFKPLLAFRLDRSGDEVTWTRHVIGKNSGHGVAAGDFSGDGRTDFATMVGWYEAPENPFDGAWEHKKEFSTKEASTPSLIMDVNGDGRNDLVYGHGHEYGFYWLEQPERDAEDRKWERHDIDATFSQAHTIAAADLDGDGVEEIITGKRVRGHAGEDPGGKEAPCIFRYTLKDGKFTRHTISFDEGVGTGMQINPHDFDGDGRIDLAVAGKTGTYVLYNRGPAKSN